MYQIIYIDVSICIEVLMVCINYILLQHCNQIYFIPDVNDDKKWFLIECNHRGKYIVCLDEEDNL